MVTLDPILTQEEINALLDTPPTSPASPQRHAARKVKDYDFRSPDKFSKDQARAFQSLHEGFARSLGASLSTFLRATVRVRVTSVDQVTYGEFVRRLPEVTVIAIFSAPPLEGAAILEMAPDIAFPMIDRLLGGAGDPLRTARELTDIERVLIESIVQKALRSLAEAWQGVLELQPRLEDLEMNLQFTPVMAENEATLLIAMEASVNEQSGLMNLCFPALSLEMVTSRFSAQIWRSGSSRSATTQMEAWQYHLREVRLPLTAYLGAVPLALRELLDLQVGDVIQLNRGVDEPVEVAVDEEVKLRGHIGTTRRHLAVQVTEVVTNDEGGEDGEMKKKGEEEEGQ